MATRKSTKTTAAKSPKPEGLTANQRWAYGFMLFFFALFVLVSVISYFLFWKDDQSVAQWGQLFDAEGTKVENWGGKLGAITANYLVSEWFGLFGFCIPVILIILALRIMRYRPVFLQKSVRLTLILMILGSVALGFLFGEQWGMFGSGLGGTHGIFMAKWLKSLLGAVGTGLLLVLLFVIYAVYINRNTIGVINRMGKGILDNSKKVGEVVGQKAASMITPDKEEADDSNEDENVYDEELPDIAPQSSFVEPQPEHVAPNRSNPTPQEPPSIYRPAQKDPSEVVRVNDLYRYTDEDGFTVRSLDDEGADSVPQEEPMQEVDEDGFIIVHQPHAGGDRNNSPSSSAFRTPSSPTTSPSEMQVDEDGFMIVNLNEAELNTPSGNTTATPPPTQVDEYGFVVEYASGDEEPESSNAYSNSATPRTDYSDRSATHESDGFTVRPIGRGNDALTCAEEVRSDLDEQGWSVREPLTEPASPTPFQRNDSDFVAHVPQDLGLHTNEQMAVSTLPSDRILGDDEIDLTPYDPRLDLSLYQMPPAELLEDHSVEVTVTSEEIVENKNRIKETLENFGIRIDKVKATVGPTVTLYEIIPAPGIRISKIKNLEDDIALSLSALGIRIIAPIPGKGTIGIEVPNKDKKVVSMYSVIKSAKFQESNFELPIVLGKTIQDETFVIDLAKMPHLLVAGATGQGKSVGLNAIITSLLYKKHPAELKLVLIDPKKVELTLYSRLERHFLAKLPNEEEAIITDTHKVVYTLNSLCIEMDSRYDLLRKAEVRHVKEYNEKFINRRLSPRKGHRYLPYIVVIIDEFADMIMTAGREVETPIARIAQLARAVGIHLVIATQRPTTNIITGVIKANFPARIAFRVSSMIDSRTIIDQPGANQLIGRGDMLVSTGNDLTRVQCAFVDTPEVERITEYVGNQRGYAMAYELPDYQPEDANGGGKSGSGDLSQLDDIFEDVARFVVQNQQGSTSSIQRRFSIGYNRAGRIMDQLEEAGIVGRAEGSKPREVLIQDAMSLEHLLNSIL